MRVAFAGGSMDLKSFTLAPPLPDTDGDGIADRNDPFFADASNGAFRISDGQKFVWTFDDTAPNGAPLGFDSGFTGLRINGTESPAQLGLNAPGFTIGGGR
jgi:hypothetical protein